MRTQDEIVESMDQACAKFILENPKVDPGKLTVYLSIEEFNYLEEQAIPSFPDITRPKLSGWATNSVPWGFQIMPSKRISPPAVLVWASLD